MMKNWEAFFRYPILERGYHCFRAGAVADLRSDETGYHAIVEGTEDYEVDIDLCGEALGELYCTCPYAAQGNNCKHMAAVLYFLEQESQVAIPETGKSSGNGQEIQSLLHTMTETETKKFLLELAKEDTSIKNRLITSFSKSITQNEVAQLKKEVDGIVYHYSGRGGFIAYNEASDFTGEIEDFLYDKCQTLIGNKFTMQAFEVVSYVFQVIGNQDIDDSAGGTGIIANLCYALWEQIVEHASEEENKVLFQWFQSHQKGYVDYMEDYLQDFLMDHFHDREMLLQKLEYLDQQIAAAEGITEEEKSWSRNFEYENTILRRIKIMKCLDLSEAEVNAYRKRYRSFPAVRKSEIDDYLEKKNYDSAIALLTESKELDKEYAGLVWEYSAKLIELYQKLNLNQQYKLELLYQVFHCRQDNLNYVKMLKQCCPSEWGTLREELLLKPGTHSVRYQLLEEEELYRRLLDEILKSGSIYNLDQYETCLKKEFPNEVRDIYINYIVSSVKSSTDRKAYQKLSKYLKKICDYPQGKEKAIAITEEWRISYKRRPAMMDELKKAGF